ncbi:unnamed protein product [Durusdinium trenchii]|uniref:Uncharacterized protein n=1 Tax=Durusdinium trenchii TaxID=1381693 RepID=A0ABP0QY35_9DINO
MKLKLMMLMCITLTKAGKFSTCDWILSCILIHLPLLGLLLVEATFIYYVFNFLGEKRIVQDEDTVCIMAASMMNQELLPSVHMMLWLWGAKRSDQRLQVKEEEGAEPEKPGELTNRRRVVWFLLLVLRNAMAIIFFVCAVRHIMSQDKASDQILNTTAMVFVLEIDEVFMNLLFSPEVLHLLSTVPAVSGELQTNHVASMHKNTAAFMKLQFLQSFVRVMGFLWATIPITKGMPDDAELSEAYACTVLLMLFASPYILTFVLLVLYKGSGLCVHMYGTQKDLPASGQQVEDTGGSPKSEKATKGAQASASSVSSAPLATGDGHPSQSTSRWSDEMDI